MSLIFANVTADDILIQAELDALIAEHPGRFRVRPGCAAAQAADLVLLLLRTRSEARTHVSNL